LTISGTLYGTMLLLERFEDVHRIKTRLVSPKEP
jgi:hypothetical protein